MTSGSGRNHLPLSLVVVSELVIRPPVVSGLSQRMQHFKVETNSCQGEWARAVLVRRMLGIRPAGIWRKRETRLRGIPRVQGPVCGTESAAGCSDRRYSCSRELHSGTNCSYFLPAIFTSGSYPHFFSEACETRCVFTEPKIIWMGSDSFWGATTSAVLDGRSA